MMNTFLSVSVCIMIFTGNNNKQICTLYINISCFSLLYTGFFSTAACLGKTVLQTPDILIKNQDESALIICTHNIPSYYRILWYKQSPDMLGFKLMGYLNYDKDNKELEFENKIKLEGDGEKNVTDYQQPQAERQCSVFLCSILHSAQNHLCLIRQPHLTDLLL